MGDRDSSRVSSPNTADRQMHAEKHQSRKKPALKRRRAWEQLAIELKLPGREVRRRTHFTPSMQFGKPRFVCVLRPGKSVAAKPQS